MTALVILLWMFSHSPYLPGTGQRFLMLCQHHVEEGNNSHCFAGHVSDTVKYSICLGHYEWAFVARVQVGVCFISLILFSWAGTYPSASQHGFTLPQVQNFALFWMLIVIAQMLLNNTDLGINHWQTFLTFDCQPLSSWCPGVFFESSSPAYFQPT